MRGGATVIVTGDPAVDFGWVTIQVAICNPKDVFCKKRGRETAEQAKAFDIPLRDLPAELGQLHRTIYKKVKVPPLRRSFEQTIRDFLPKGE
jgi:hypothetical protein